MMNLQSVNCVLQLRMVRRKKGSVTVLAGDIQLGMLLKSHEKDAWERSSLLGGIN